MSLLEFAPHVVSVTEASSRGVAGLVKAAEKGEDLVVQRRGKDVAAIVSMGHLARLRKLEEDLRDSVLMLAREATDSGTRTDLNAAIAAFGFDRVELEAELDADLAAGRA